MFNICYLDSDNGNDSNSGKIKENSFKSIKKCKEFLFKNGNEGIIYIIGKNIIPKGELNIQEMNKKLSLKGIDFNSEIFYVYEFGDYAPTIMNVDLYNLIVSYGEKRWDFDPKSENVNFYNCIINYSGVTIFDHSNFYNCIFYKGLTRLDYRTSESDYHHKGEFINCIFNSLYFTNDNNFRKAINLQYNMSTSIIDKYIKRYCCMTDKNIINKGSPNILNKNGTISNLGIYGGPYALDDNLLCLLKTNDEYYSINSNFYKNGQYEKLKINDFKYGFKLYDIFSSVNKSSIELLNDINEIIIDSNFLELYDINLKNNKDITDNLKEENFTSSRYHICNYEYKAYMAFDNHNDTSICNGFQIKNPNKNEYLIINLGDKYKINKISIQATISKFLPKKINIYMSNDNDNYEFVDEIDNIKNDLEINYYEFNNDIKYRYVKLEFVELYDENWIEINQIQLFESTRCKMLIKNMLDNNLYTIENSEVKKIENNEITKDNILNNGFLNIKLNKEFIIKKFNNLNNIRLIIFIDMNNKNITLDYKIKDYVPINELKYINNGKFDILIKEGD